MTISSPTPFPILVTSLPKNGTHLLLNTLANIPGLHEKKLLKINWAQREKIFPSLQTLRAGEFTKSHLIHSGRAETFFRQNNFRLFNMIRDPRDNVVSHMHYLKKTEDHRLHNIIWEKYDNDHDRLMACITGFHFTEGGEKKKLNAIDQQIMNWWKWNDCDFCLPVRFEKLVGSQGGGSDEAQQQQVRDILQHLEIIASDTLVNQVANACFDRNTYSFRKGQIGDWRNHFSEEHKRVFKQRVNPALIHYGYEKTEHW